MKKTKNQWVVVGQERGSSAKWALNVHGGMHPCMGQTAKSLGTLHPATRFFSMAQEAMDFSKANNSTPGSLFVTHVQLVG